MFISVNVICILITIKLICHLFDMYCYYSIIIIDLESTQLRTNITHLIFVSFTMFYNLLVNYLAYLAVGCCVLVIWIALMNNDVLYSFYLIFNLNCRCLNSHSFVLMVLFTIS